jgi:hypothetical protein
VKTGCTEQQEFVLGTSGVEEYESNDGDDPDRMSKGVIASWLWINAECGGLRA